MNHDELKFEALVGILDNLVKVKQLTPSQFDLLMMNKYFMAMVRPAMDELFVKMLSNNLNVREDFEPVYRIMFMHL